MPSNRPNLTLDEQSFQGLLSAAFIVQEHNDRQKQARRAQELQSEGSGASELRPGERLQHNWASMWLMSQERGLWPERSTGILEAPPKEAAQSHSITAAEDDAENFVPEEFPLVASDALAFAASSEESSDTKADATAPPSFLRRVADLRVKLRFQRADLYLGTAIFVAALALLWPAAGSLQPAALSPWERALVTLGIAEAPAPVIHLQGDPSIAVWVDPHSAVYYCPGEEQYGKTSGGRLSSQHDAQMDRFEPAGRLACE